MLVVRAAFIDFFFEKNRTKNVKKKLRNTKQFIKLIYSFLLISIQLILFRTVS